jgi:hypothetical protein
LAAGSAKRGYGRERRVSGQVGHWARIEVLGKRLKERCKIQEITTEIRVGQVTENFAGISQTSDFARAEC